MQFIVFAAFAIVLSLPNDGPPWRTLHSPVWTGLIVVGQVLVVIVMGAIASARVKRRLDRDPAWLPGAQHVMSRWTTAIRFVLIGAFAVTAYLTDWSVDVRGHEMPRGDVRMSAHTRPGADHGRAGLAHATQPGGKGFPPERMSGKGFPLEQVSPEQMRGKGFPLKQPASPLEQVWWRRVWGLDELLILMPFLLAVVGSWIALYPADRAVRQVSLELRLWASQPSRPVWGLWTYVAFMFRHHVLIILAPMVPIVIAIDAVSSEQYGRWLRRATGVVWADQAVLVAVAGLVFLIAPLFLRYVWQTQTLPRGDLRDRLDGLCRRIGLRHRDILIWQSDGMMVNAAVMGLVRQVRYVLLSDGLLEMMDDNQIEAVFGHEAGHVKKHHITFYMLFAVFSMLLVGGINELVVRFPSFVAAHPELNRLLADTWLLHLLADRQPVRDYLQVIAMGLIVAMWGIGFGPVSRRFERQADLFGARSVTPDIQNCDRPCRVHGTFGDTAGGPGATDPGQTAVCATAAHLFGEALRRIAVLNGIPIDSRGWRHPSIASRISLLKSYAVDPAAVVRLNRGVLLIKIVLVLGTAVGLAIGAWLYWPADLMHRLFRG